MTSLPSPPFRQTPDGIEVDELNLNTFQLGPIVRKYTPAKMQIKGIKRTTSVDFSTLFDSLGLFRSLHYDVLQFNSLYSTSITLTSSEIRYSSYRLMRQASAFGIRLPKPGSAIIDVPGLDELLALIESKYSNEITTAKSMIRGGICDFNSLFELYSPGTDLVDRGAATGVFGVPTCMKVRASYISRGKSLFGITSTFYASMEFAISIGDGKYAIIEFPFPIAEFNGQRSVTDGMDTFILLSSSIERELITRGERYATMTSTRTSCTYVEHLPGSFLPAARSGYLSKSAPPRRVKGGGRMMIDTLSAAAHGVSAARSEGVACDAINSVFKLLSKRNTTTTTTTTKTAQDLITSEHQNPSSAGQLIAAEEEENLDLLILSSPLPPSLQLRTWPVLAGFSFSAKTWGVVLVSGLSEIKFNEEAFNRLVMPASRKNLIEALVTSHKRTSGDITSTNSSRRSADVIAGKGEGTIFLLYGPPGVGKTLTAEAIAEMLHKPLYVVSMGELGTTPEVLEERLHDILSLCVPWEALVLIDEAEMLLERRTKNDLVRNAMVCVMLRLLEYYSGILFLTTNRVESLDPAFQSRVQCALRYDALNEESRARIWRDVLLHMGSEEGLDNNSNIDIVSLSKYELNGRQIKNCLQLANALAKHEGCKIEQRHLDTTVEITMAFVNETTSEKN